jgi:hypothetical protein
MCRLVSIFSAEGVEQCTFERWVVNESREETLRMSTHLPLPPLTHVAPIYFTRHFLLTIVLTVVMCCSINGLIDWLMHRHDDSDSFYLVDSKLAPTIFIFVFIMSFLAFAGSGEVHKRIKAGKQEAVRCYALKDTFIKRFVFFPIGEPNWKCRLPLWVWWSLMVPGMGTLVLLVAFCWAATGFHSINSKMCPTTLAMWVLWTEAWKGFIAVILTTVNYAAAHNDEQGELQVELLSAEDKTEEAGLYTQPGKTV